MSNASKLSPALRLRVDAINRIGLARREGAGTFTVPAGEAIDRACYVARRSAEPCKYCGCVVCWDDAHGSWCLGCGN